MALTLQDETEGARRAGGLLLHHPLRPNGLPRTSSIRHGLTECSGPPHSAHRSRSDSCAMGALQKLVR